MGGRIVEKMAMTKKYRSGARPEGMHRGGGEGDTRGKPRKCFAGGGGARGESGASPDALEERRGWCKHRGTGARPEDEEEELVAGQAP